MTNSCVGQRRDDGVVPGREIFASGQLQPSVMKDSIGDKFGHGNVVKDDHSRC